MIRPIFLAALLLAPAAAFAAPPDGKSIVLHGNANGALPCAACHGVTGAGNPAMGAPALAGLPAPVIVNALNNFAQGEGGNAIMQSIARSLSPDERTAVADYFANEKGKGP